MPGSVQVAGETLQLNGMGLRSKLMFKADAAEITISGLPFAQAMFACWLGPKPPGEDFKAGLLGK